MKVIVYTKIIIENIEKSRTLVNVPISLMFKDFYEDIYEHISDKIRNKIFGLHLKDSICYSIGKAVKGNSGAVVTSFADGCSCGDGTIYRASNFILTGIRENKTILQFPTGDKIAAMTLEANFNIPAIKQLCCKMNVEHKYRTRSEWVKLGAKYVEGFQLRYIYFIDKSYRKKLTVQEIPFSRIDEMGAGMYKGEKVAQAERHAIKTK